MGRTVCTFAAHLPVAGLLLAVFVRMHAAGPEALQHALKVAELERPRARQPGRLRKEHISFCCTKYSFQDFCMFLNWFVHLWSRAEGVYFAGRAARSRSPRVASIGTACTWLQSATYYAGRDF